MTGYKVTDAFPPMEMEALCWHIKNFASLSIQQQTDFVSTLVNIHPIVNIAWSGQELFRVRAITDADIISSVSDVIWPNTLSTKPGRLHVEGHPVVYLASSHGTALRETHVEEGLVAIASFSPIPDVSIRLCPIGEITLILRTGRGQVIDKKYAKEFVSFLDACPIEKVKAICIADAFLYEQLNLPGDNYNLTSLVPQAIFRKNPSIDAFLYPSQMQMAGINIAVRRDRFWQKWGLTSVNKAKAMHLASGLYRMSEIAQVDGIYGNGTFNWSGVLVNDESRILLTPPWQPHNIL